MRPTFRYTKVEPMEGYDAAYEVRFRPNGLLLGTVQREDATNVGIRGGDLRSFTGYTPEGKCVFSWPPTRERAAQAIKTEAVREGRL